MKKVKNEDIAYQINKKYDKTYTPNYISTIFRQRIIPKINEAAAFHEKIVSNLFFEEEFKTCPGCGQTLLRCPENFTRKSRSKDGYTSRCKKCEKAARKK
jgi:NAD-dependent dihydropyrimidine dehydrogenase PreA subunit